jgi:hypothetical protein
VTRPDRSYRTIWRAAPDDADLKNTTMEVVLPESAELSDIEPGLLAPDVLPDLWKGADISVADVRSYFEGGRVIKIARQGYDEPVPIPKAAQAVVDGAIGWAVKEGKLWLTHGPTSLCAEEIPAGLLRDDALLQAPPAPIPATDVVPSNLPAAWTTETTTAQAIADALSATHGKSLPWATVRAAIDGACKGRLLERTADSTPWPCDEVGATQVKLRTSEKKTVVEITRREDTHRELPPGVLVASALLKPNEVQELADQIGEIGNAAVGFDLKITVSVEIGGAGKRPPEGVVAKINAKLAEIAKDFKLG